MGSIELIISLVVFVATAVGVVLYLRADARANRQELRDGQGRFTAELAELRAELTGHRAEVNGQLAEFRAELAEFRAELIGHRAEVNGQLAEFRAEFNSAISKLSADIEGLNQRVMVLESKVEALDTKIDAKAAELSAQMQRNHRELLIRLAFHHHGDGRYPVSAATDPDPVDPSGDGE